jgi:hypothetical protein
VTIETTGTYAYGVGAQDSSTLALSGGTITTSADDTHGITLSNSSSGTVSNVSIETTGVISHGVFANSSTLTLTDSDNSATGSNANTLYLTFRSTGTVSLNGNTLTGGIYAGGTSTLTLSGSNGTVLTGNVTGSSNSTIDLSLSGEDTRLIGNIIKDSASTVNLTLGGGASFVGSGTLTNLTLEDGAILGYANDILYVDGTLTLGDSILIDLSALTETGNYTLLDWNGATISGGSVTEAQFINASDGVEGTFSVNGSTLIFNATAIPEPSTCFLLGTGLGLLLLTLRQHRRNAQS